jgi:DNA polymerase-3 subunit alpha
MTSLVSAPFVSLHNHTELGSPLDGMNRTNEIFDRAKEVGHPALAITDHGTLAAHYDCWKESKRTGVKLIPGIEAYFVDDGSKKKANHMVLLAQNEKGYKNILRLSYESFKIENQIKGYMGKEIPCVSWNHIEKYNEGVVCLTACSNGLIAKTLITEENEELALCYIDRLNAIFNNRFYLEIQPHALFAEGKNGKVVNQTKLNEAMIRISHDKNIPYVITCDAHYRDKDHAKYHDMMLAIKDKKPISDPNRFKYGVQDMYLKDHEEIIDFFGKDVADLGMKNSLRINDMCEVPHYLENPSKAILPKFPIKNEKNYGEFHSWYSKNCPDIDEDKAYLRYQCMLGFTNKLGDLSPNDKKEYWERVKKELSILESRDFSSYMLIVADYINWAKNNGIPCGPGRGSASGSLIAYLTGITTIDPIKYDLIFERFHNKEKKSFPDIDTDFADPGRVKEYLKQKYGEDRVASIGNYNTLSPKVIVKDVARSLEVGGSKSAAFKIANVITSTMPDVKSIEDAVQESAVFAAYMKEYPELYEYACKLQGLTRNFAVHAAGVVIGDRPLYELVPLRIDGSTGLVITQWEKTRCEDFGLVKMDILGLNTLTLIDECLKTIEEVKDIKINMDDIPIDDPGTFEMISKGFTAGVFQLESTLTPLCKQIKPKNLEVISAINALGRPSCQPEIRELYINRELGKDDLIFEHPNLKRALEKTNGILLYEESAMFIAQDFAGWDLNEADALRKLSKLKGKDPMLAFDTEKKFIRDAMEFSGVNQSFGQHVWDYYILPLSGYSFNKAHSISYSHISVYTAWLKKNFPTEFMCSLLNSVDPNGNEAQDYIKECLIMGMKILPPDINNSGWKYKVLKPGAIVTGLSAIKGAGGTAILDIINNKPYRNIAEFFAFTNARVVNKRVVESLAKAGAFDSLGIKRKNIHDNFVKYRAKVNNHVKSILSEKNINKENEDSNLNEDDEHVATLPLRDVISNIDVSFDDSGDEWGREDLLKNEKESLGRCISGSMHEVFGSFFRKDASNVTRLSEINSLKVKTKIKIEVIINNKIKEFIIKNGANKGKKFAKYAIEDVDGNLSELTLWADDYERYGPVFKDGMAIKAICQVNEYMGTKSISLEKLERKI